MKASPDRTAAPDGPRPAGPALSAGPVAMWLTVTTVLFVVGVFEIQQACFFMGGVVVGQLLMNRGTR